MKYIFFIAVLALLFTVPCSSQVQGVTNPSTEKQGEVSHSEGNPNPQKVDQSPGNPFEDGISQGETKDRALAWFDYLKTFLTLAAGYVLKWMGKKWPSLKFGKWLPAVLFLLSFTAFGLGYGWDIKTLLNSVVSIGTAILAHTVVLNPVEAAAKKSS